MNSHHQLPVAIFFFCRVIFLSCHLRLIYTAVLPMKAVSLYPVQHGSRRDSDFKPNQAAKFMFWKNNIGKGQYVNRVRRHEFGSVLDPVNDRTWGSTFGMGYDSKVRERFLQEKEEYRLRNGGFLPPSVCPEYRPYIFYCDPRDRTGPINPVTGQSWPNGIYFSTPKTSFASSSTTITSRQLLLRPPCDSILCPVGGNEGYGYTGLEEVTALH